MNKGYQIVLPISANNVTMLKERIVRGDSDTHIFNLHLMDGGKPFNLKDITAIKINVKKEDDTLTMITSGNKNLLIKDVSAGEINLTLPDHMTNVPGLCRLSVELYEQERRLTTTTLIYQVIESLADGDRSIADNVDAFAALQEYIRKESGTITINSVTTGAPSNVTNIGTPQAAVLNFTLEKGEKGDKGDQGIQGLQGIQGPKGDKGDKGEKGDQGIQGIQGIQGEQGVKGEKGDQGYQGIQGVQGIKGDKGDQGIPGPQGPQGEKGEQGFRGVQGLQGPQGEQGIQGPVGLTGATGPQGPIGLTGEKGDKGEQGIQGIQGEPGTDGTLVNLNGEVQTNVNFIRNDVVQSGLIAINTNSKKKTLVDVNSSFLTVDFKISNLKATSAWQRFIRIARDGGSVCTVSLSNEIIISYGSNTFHSVKLNASNIFNITVTNTKASVYLNGINIANRDFSDSQNIKSITILEETADVFSADVDYYIAYTRPLTPQEIQHNFSVLNNTPSINHINDYALSTDTDHITDSGSMLQSKINRVFYKNMCKEFTSNGEPIVVNNGMDGYVLSGKIEGQTVKNCIPSISSFIKEYGLLKVDNNCLTIDGDGESKIYYSIPVEQNTEYEIRFEVEGKKDLSNCVGSITRIDKTKAWEIDVSNGTVITTQNSLNDSVWKLGIYVYKTSGIKIKNISVIRKSDVPKVSYPINYGLNSTQATISNNGLKYSFYSSLEDKLANRVIDLGGLEGARNTFEIKEDGSAIYTQNTNCYTIVGNEPTGVFIEGTNVDYLSFGNMHNINNISTLSVFNAICDKTNQVTIGDRDKVESIGKFYWGKTNCSIVVPKGKTAQEALNTFIGYTFCFNINPIVTHIPKELVPTILTQATNEFKFGDAVAPYKVTIQAPVNRIADFETRIAQLEKVITSTSNLSLLGNYAEDEYNKEINQL